MEKGIYLHHVSQEEFQTLIHDSVKTILERQETKSPASTTSPEPEKLLSRKEISQYLGITLTTLHKWMNKGLPFKILNGRRYFLLSEVISEIERTKTISK